MNALTLFPMDDAPRMAPIDPRPMIVDSFAGGGGASTGIELALGRSPDIAINHSETALALHAANHPHTLHLSENVYRVDPLTHLAGRHIGLMWFSPDCKHFSKAKGGAPVKRNIRDLAWIIPGWIERIQKSGGRVDVVLLENVEEFKTWGPLIETKRGLMPDPSRAGETFDAWCKALRRLGGKIEARELRACDYGAPTIRKRLFVVVRFDKQKIVWPAPTHGNPSSAEVKAGKLQPWRTAAECIDWSQPCPSIFDSKAKIKADLGIVAVRPLADNTMARIARGMKRYVLQADRPFLVELTHGARVEDLVAPLKTITTAHRGEKALIAPSITRFNGGATGHDLRDPMATVTANSWIKRPGGAAPLGIIAPALATLYGHGDGRGVRAGDLGAPLRTVTVENRHALITPSLISIAHGDSGGRREYPLTDPLGTVTVGGIQHALVSPILTYAQQGGGNRSPLDPHHTICASRKDQNSVIIPTLIQTGYGERAGQAPRALDIGAPLGTVVAGGVKHAAVSAVIASIMGCGGRAAQSRPRGLGEPMATVTSKADACISAAFLAQHHTGATGHDASDPLSTVAASGSHQMPVQATVAPWFAKYYGAGTGARTDEPAHTITVNDRFAHVEAALHAPPFAEAHHARAREVAEFLRRHGAWDGGEFVTLTIAGQTFVVVDIGMRMLTPRELFNAQGFPADYVIDGVWQGLDSDDPQFSPFAKDIQVSCCGNSVCPPLAEAMVRANCLHLMANERAA